MTLAAPQALWLLSLVPVVIALHYLRARRRQRPVAALFLWRSAQQAAARKRRFSPTWLLALQLLFVVASAVAMAGPRKAAEGENPLVIVVDASASMSAVGASGSRLDLAREEASARLAGRRSVALIRAGATARLLTPIESSAPERIAALAQVLALDPSADLPAAVELGRSLLPDADVVVITDRAAELGRAEVVVVGEPVENVGIAAFDVGVGQAFVSVVASGRLPEEVTVGLFAGSEELARSTLLVPAGGSSSFTFPLLDDPSRPTGILEARILSPASDALALDDLAFAGQRTLTVVSEDLYAPLIRALQALPNARVYGSSDATRQAADLRVVSRNAPDPQAILDEFAPSANSAVSYVVIPPPASAPLYQVVRSQDRTDPLMRFVELEDAVVGLDPAAEPWIDAPGTGWHVLARSDDLRPLLRVHRSATGSVLQFAFHPSQSDVVLRPAFPALIANWLSAVGATPRVRLGETLPGWPLPASTPGVYDLATGALISELPGTPSPPPGATGPVALAALLSAEESRLPTTGGAESGAITGVADPARERSGATSDGDVLGNQEGTGSSPELPWPAALLIVLGLAALAVEWLLHARGRRAGSLVG